MSLKHRHARTCELAPRRRVPARGRLVTCRWRSTRHRISGEDDTMMQPRAWRLGVVWGGHKTVSGGWGSYAHVNITSHVVL